MDEHHKAQSSPVSIAEEMRQSYLDYAMSVIVGRALPDARDGLKPVHRRALYAMYELGNTSNRPYKKSARIVGDVIGKYHPHGDAAVYDTIVRMAQEFSLRYPLIDGQGNFGSVDGDPAAAMRYTEVRMTRLAEELLADLDRDTVPFAPNYDGTAREPEVLPARVPNLLVNGSSGIAVGMSTNIPPHNLGEVADALTALLENPALTVSELMRHVPGPDFPTGGIITGREGIVDAYAGGRGVVQMRARAFTETDGRSGRTSIVVKEIPFQVNKARLLERIAELVNQKRIEGVSDLRDESDRDGMRVVIDLKRDASPEVILNQLYKLTPMQESFGVNLLAIADGRPQVLPLRDLLRCFLDHRREVLRRRTVFDLRKAEDRLHLLEGFRTILGELDQAIGIIRQRRNPAAARDALMAHFGLSANQAQAVLEMRLQRLTQMEREKILDEHRETADLIARLRRILAAPAEIDRLIAEDLAEIKRTYADRRRTEIVDETAEIEADDLIVEEDMVVTVSHEGYIKRTPASVYRAQRRGGKGVIGATTRAEDFVESLFVASTHSYLLFFTTTGRVHWARVRELPQAGRAGKGKAIVNLLRLDGGERISAFLPVREFRPDRYVVFATRRGVVKKTPLMAYSNPRREGIIAIGLDEGDEVVGVKLTDGGQDVLLSTGGGKAIRFAEGGVRPTGRGTHGVHGIQLDAGDAVVSLEVVSPGAAVLAVSALGYGKRSEVGEYRAQSRGGKGVLTMRATRKTGKVVAVQQVMPDDEMMLVTDGGRVIRLRVAEIRMAGRNTQGVRLIGVGQGEKVVSVARLAERDEGEEIH